MSRIACCRVSIAHGCRRAELSCLRIEPLDVSPFLGFHP